MVKRLKDKVGIEFIESIPNKAENGIARLIIPDV
jgi:hypothetical protein